MYRGPDFAAAGGKGFGGGVSGYNPGHNARGRFSEGSGPTSPSSPGPAEPSILRGKPVRPLTSITPHAHGDAHAMGFNSATPPMVRGSHMHGMVMSPPHASLPIRCCDPYNQKVYEVPPQYVEDTQGKLTFASNPSGRRAQICMKYQDERCNMKSRCQQIHADRAWVQDMRSRFFEHRKEYVSDIVAFDPMSGEHLAFKYSEVDNCAAKERYRALPYDHRAGFVLCREYVQSGACHAGRVCNALHVLPEKYNRVMAQQAERRTKGEGERSTGSANSSGSSNSAGPSTPLTPGFSPSVVPSPAGKPFHDQDAYDGDRDIKRDHAPPPTTYGSVSHVPSPVAPVSTRSGYGPQYGLPHSVSDSSLGYDEKYVRHPYNGKGSSPRETDSFGSMGGSPGYGMDDSCDRYGKGAPGPNYYRGNRGNNTPPEMRHPVHPRDMDAYAPHPHVMDAPSPHFVDSPSHYPHDMERTYSSDVLSNGYDMVPHDAMPHMHDMSPHGPPCIDMSTGEYIVGPDMGYTPDMMMGPMATSPGYHQNLPYDSAMDAQEQEYVARTHYDIAPRGPSKALQITRPPVPQEVETPHSSDEQDDDDDADQFSTPNSRSHSAPPVGRLLSAAEQLESACVDEDTHIPHSSFDVQCSNNSIGAESKLGKIGLEGIDAGAEEIRAGKGCRIESPPSVAKYNVQPVDESADTLVPRRRSVTRTAAYRSRSK